MSKDEQYQRRQKLGNHGWGRAVEGPTDVVEEQAVEMAYRRGAQQVLWYALEGMRSGWSVQDLAAYQAAISEWRFKGEREDYRKTEFPPTEPPLRQPAVSA